MMPTQANNCFTCQARHRTEWCVLSDDELKLVDDNRVSRSFIPGEVIYNEGDESRGIHCVEAGLIGVRKYDSEGNSILLHLATAGETLGYRALLTNNDHQSSAEVLEPSTICFISAQTVRSLLEKNPALGLRFLKRASNELEVAEEKIFHNVTMPVRARFAHLLMVLIDRSGIEKAVDSLTDVELPISRMDMASMIGTTPESVSRTIRKMEDEGVVHFSGTQGRYLSVPDIRSLADEFEPRDFI